MKLIKGLFKGCLGVVVVLVLIGVIFGGGSSDEKSSDSGSSKQEAAVEKADKEEAADEEEAEPEEEAEAEEDSGPEMATDSDYAVTINGFRIVEDYDGSPCIAIDYTFTNVSDDDPTSMMLATNITVYQDGVECEDAYFAGENSDGYSNKVKAGVSVDGTRAYKLQNTTSDVEVEVAQLSFWDDSLLAYQVFQIA